jgi:hypothetical protein
MDRKLHKEGEGSDWGKTTRNRPVRLAITLSLFLVLGQASAEHTLPERTSPEHTLPEQNLSEHTLREKNLSEHTLPEQTSPEQTLPE